jgi:NurA-like 5'-3' nuclease
VEADQCFTRRVREKLSGDGTKGLTNYRVLVVHYFLMGAMKKYNNQITELSDITDLNKDLARLAKVPKKPTDWVSLLLLHITDVCCCMG